MEQANSRVRDCLGTLSTMFLLSQARYPTWARVSDTCGRRGIGDTQSRGRHGVQVVAGSINHSDSSDNSMYPLPTNNLGIRNTSFFCLAVTTVTIYGGDGCDLCSLNMMKEVD